MPLRVFIVDRGRLSAEGVAELIRFMGHEVRAVSRVDGLLDEALGFQADLALIDWSLPAAVELCQELSLSGARLYAFASHPDAIGFDRARDAGVQGFLSAPCDRSKLSKLLSTVQEDVFLRRDEVKVGGESRWKRWLALVEAAVVRFYGGTRDGQVLSGDRAAQIYRMLYDDPLNRTFLACRKRLVWRDGEPVSRIERHRYFVEEVRKSADQLLMIARSLGVSRSTRL